MGFIDANNVNKTKKEQIKQVKEENKKRNSNNKSMQKPDTEINVNCSLSYLHHR